MKKIVNVVLIIISIASTCLLPLGVSGKQSYEKSSLPKLYFLGPVDEITSKNEEIKIAVKYVDEELNFDGYAKIKWQGSSSLNYDKKNYTIKFYEDSDLENKLKVDFGWGKQNKYCLKANWVDKTHARNIVTAKLAGKVQKKYNILNESPNNGTIDGFPIEIYLNGEFLGLYTMNIPKDAWLFSMNVTNPNHIVLAGDMYTEPVVFKDTVTELVDFSLEVGEDNDVTIKALNRLITFVKDSTDQEFKENIDDYFNLDSLLNYYIFMQIAQMYDNCAKNMLLVTYDQKVWYTSLYDLDSTWGTYWDGKNLYDYTIPLETDSVLWNKLIKNFSHELADRYFELRGNILTQENIMKEFNDFYNLIPEKTWAKEHSRWDDIPGYGLEQINEFLEVRLPIMDRYFSDMYVIDINMAGVCIKEDEHIIIKLVNLDKNEQADIPKNSTGFKSALEELSMKAFLETSNISF